MSFHMSWNLDLVFSIYVIVFVSTPYHLEIIHWMIAQPLNAAFHTAQLQ